MNHARVFLVLLVALAAAATVHAYPPAVGITGKSRSCTQCHSNNGPWSDEKVTIVDLLDGDTRRSLKQPDGSFLLEVERGQTRTVITIIGRPEGDKAPPPTRNAWLYVDPGSISSSSLSKFAPGWDVNLPMSCRMVGDKTPEYSSAAVTALGMTVRPTAAARDAVIELQVMLTSGESVKNNPNAGLKGNYLMRKVTLKVREAQGQSQ
jgi:hypothetical protein